MSERLSDYIGQYTVDLKNTPENNRLSEESIKLFVDKYLEVVDSTRLENDEHPLIYYVKNTNRLPSQVSPIVAGVDHFGKTGDFGKLFNSFDYTGMIGENVERPLDYADDYDIGPYYHRRRTLREEFALPYHSLRYKIRSRNAETRKVQTLSSFYFQSSLSLYESADNFMHMLTADVFHARGEWYFKNVVRLLWEDCARMNGYNISGYHYPNGKLDETPESRKFKDPLFDAVNWLNLYACGVWGQYGHNSQNPRDVLISGIVSKDRMREYDLHSEWLKKRGLDNKASDYQSVSMVLNRLGIDL